MRRLTYSDITLPVLREICSFAALGRRPALWEGLRTPLCDQDRTRLELLRTGAAVLQPSLLNEATLWSRVIFPLLVLTEQYPFLAWSQAPLSADYPSFRLEGTVDGVLADCTSGTPEAPYLVVHEAKRGLDAGDPRWQLCGQLLAAAWQNHALSPGAEPVEVFGCYTVCDNWTFVRGAVRGVADGTPSLEVETSREFAEPQEAGLILEILRGIIARTLVRSRPGPDPGAPP